MHVFADYHIHSSYSDGRASIKEIAEAARKKGLEEIAITDHGPRNLGARISRLEYLLTIKKEIEKLNRSCCGIRILAGVEANVIGGNGEIDVPAGIYRNLDLLLVGLHPYVLPDSFSAFWNIVLKNQLYRCWKGLYNRVVVYNTRALTKCLEKHPVDIVTHPGLKMPVDVALLARACARAGTAYEVNVGHLFQEAEELRKAAGEGACFVINSDAHYKESVGELREGALLLEIAGVPVERIRNAR